MARVYGDLRKLFEQKNELASESTDCGQSSMKQSRDRDCKDREASKDTAHLDSTPTQLARLEEETVRKFEARVIERFHIKVAVDKYEAEDMLDEILSDSSAAGLLEQSSVLQKLLVDYGLELEDDWGFYGTDWVFYGVPKEESEAPSRKINDFKELCEHFEVVESSLRSKFKGSRANMLRKTYLSRPWVIVADFEVHQRLLEVRKLHENLHPEKDERDFQVDRKRVMNDVAWLNLNVGGGGPIVATMKMKPPHFGWLTPFSEYDWNAWAEEVHSIGLECFPQYFDVDAVDWDKLAKEDLADLAEQRERDREEALWLKSQIQQLADPYRKCLAKSSSDSYLIERALNFTRFEDNDDDWDPSEAVEEFKERLAFIEEEVERVKRALSRRTASQVDDDSTDSTNWQAACTISEPLYDEHGFRRETPEEKLWRESGK